MSYCRWSSDDYQCDVYCYESDAGYVIHVAKYRYTFTGPLPPPLVSDSALVVPEVRFARDEAVRALLSDEKSPIGLAHDGETFVEQSALEAHGRLLVLREAGYRVPDFAIDKLEREAYGA